MTTTLAALLALTNSTSTHGGRVGPTVGAVAFESGLSYVRTLNDLREMRADGQVYEYRDRGETVSRFLPTAETAAVEGQR